MKLKALMLCIACLVLAWTASADTIRLKTGQVFYGQFLGRNSEGIRFAANDGVTYTFLPEQVASLNFEPVFNPPTSLDLITIPGGTTILVQMVDTLDTSHTQTGQIFSATLATNLLANGTVVARKGTPVYGQVIESASAGRTTGKSQLKIQLTQIVIGGNPVPLVTNTFDSEGKGSGRRSARRLFGGAGLGAAFGAIAGDAAMGAAIGAAVGAAGAVVQKGDQVQIPSETLLQFVLQQPISLPALP